MERNLYRICILFSNPNKILFKSNHPTLLNSTMSVNDEVFVTREEEYQRDIRKHDTIREEYI